MSSCPDCPHLMPADATNRRAVCCCEMKQPERAQYEALRREADRINSQPPSQPMNRAERRRAAKLGRKAIFPA